MKARALGIGAVAWAVGCNGILGLDESHLRPPDAGETDAQATADGGHGDGDGDAPCAPLGLDASDFYVDAAAGEARTGTQACPLRTISAALAAAASSRAARRTVHVAAGRYDAALGEVFPLVVRGVALEGAGHERTVISGAGGVALARFGGALRDPVRATLLVGHPTAETSIVGLTLAPGPVPLSDTPPDGIVCNAGNAAWIADPVAEPNTIVRQVSLADFNRGLIVTTSADPSPRSGCNLRLLGATIQHTTLGAWLVGCGTGLSPSVSWPVAAKLGDGTSAGTNRFLSMTGAYNAAIQPWDCTSSLEVKGNEFRGGEFGVQIFEHAITDAPVYPGRFVIQGNSFREFTRAGVSAVIAAVIDRLEDNVFEGNTGKVEAAAGLLLGGGAEPFFAHVKRARRNRFVGNDIAVLLTGGPLSPDARVPTTNFGDPGDPGANVFRCNGARSGATFTGADVFVDATGTIPALGFAGNAWDHAAPTGASGASPPNGTDVWTRPTSGAIALDTRGATLSTEACPQGRTPGP